MNQALMPSLARRSMTPHMPDQPVKKQSKWSPEEDALIIELRGSGMKWEDVSKRLPGRSAISCRLHYQNYLERRSEWDEERKNKLARLYERFKADMWAKVAEELQVPWRAAEAMHWQLGEADMARRAGVVPFSLAAVNVEASNRSLPPRGHGQTHSQDSSLRDMRPSPPRTPYGRGQAIPMAPGPGAGAGPRGNRRSTTQPMTASQAQQQATSQSSSQVSQQSVPVPVPVPVSLRVLQQHVRAPPHQMGMSQPPPQPVAVPPMSHSHGMQPQGDYRHNPGPGLAPIQKQGQSRNPGPLPSVAQLTNGMNPFDPSGGPTTSGPLASMSSAGPLPPRYPTLEAVGTKRRASPDMGHGENGHKRRM